MSRRYFSSVVYIFLPALGVLASVFAAGAVWVGPPVPPAYDSYYGASLNPITPDIADLVRTGISTPQVVSGPLYVGHSDTTAKDPAYLGYVDAVNNNKISVIASGIGTYSGNYQATLPVMTNTNIGIYSEASNGTNNYGLYGFGYGDNTVQRLGLRAETSAVAGSAAQFLGLTQVRTNGAALGDATVDGRIASYKGVALSGGSGATLNFNNSGAGQAEGLILKSVAKLRGVSTNGGTFGNGLNLNVNEVSGGSATYGLWAKNITGRYGVYGLASAGSGIYATTQNSAHNLLGLEGIANNGGIGLMGLSQATTNGGASPSGIGIYACGTQYAASFESNVNIAGALDFGVFSSASYSDGKTYAPDVVIDEAEVRDILSDCRRAGQGCTCGNNTTLNETQFGEECDSTNLIDGDGCSKTCKNETTVVFQDGNGGTTTDAQMSSANPGTNYGSLGTMQAGIGAASGNRYRSLLAFDVSSIPSNAVIVSAQVKLRVTAVINGTSFQVGLFRLLQTWTEAAATWTNYKASTPWNAGGALADSDVTPPNSTADRRTTYESATAITTTGDYFWDVKTAVQSWVSGSWPNQGLALFNSAELSTTLNSTKTFATSENTTAAYRPQLTIIYYVP